MTAHGLIDTTEMYLRTVFELEEEGIVPLRARIAERVKATRDATFTTTWTGKGRDGKTVTKTVNHCATIASLGGATMDNEWNYVQLKLWRALGLIWLENQARI